ncbi:DNA polymerase III subunit chi [Sulfitobacter sp.]|jgi:DNA polymerase III subunit chi|uniref:DNA polymerase III subunit chi n=1 Tax=Sulfitobacter sp. TaxID=1903071 RepID=UPI000C0C7575|nr:DNA polymerase III subunit chi [Roseobacter sp.]MBV47015.1 DNA polymerase III subunit chi [Roseobacter sp.]PHR06809.1 MAG: DNA polymerase III subunit chi [Sulfitobacter sp.]|tara:strand:+ start:3655 stop:4113 length:459 start_codon:yes stop_codon:yes gene_type:complete
MGVAYFYHLTQRPLVETLTMLLGKARSAGWRVVIRGTDADMLAQMDVALWRGPDDAFLAHGLAGGDHDADQPILLTTSVEAANGATCLFSIHGADVSPEEVARLDRVCILFDGLDDAALNAARGQWVKLKKAGARAQYWSEESGIWEKKSET